MTPGPNGGFIPSPSYRPGAMPPPLPSIPSRSGSGYAGGYRPGAGADPGPELGTRAGPGEPRPGGAFERSPGGFGGYGPRPPGGAGMGGGMPMGMGGGGHGGQDNEHRNTTFLPSDEPFVVEFGDVAPAVITAENLANPEQWR